MHGMLMILLVCDDNLNKKIHLVIDSLLLYCFNNDRSSFSLSSIEAPITISYSHEVRVTALLLVAITL